MPDLKATADQLNTEIIRRRVELAQLERIAEDLTKIYAPNGASANGTAAVKRRKAATKATKRQDEAVAYVREHEWSAAAEIAAGIGIGAPQTHSLCKRLVGKGLLTMREQQHGGKKIREYAVA